MVYSSRPENRLKKAEQSFLIALMVRDIIKKQKRGIKNGRK